MPVITKSASPAPAPLPAPAVVGFWAQCVASDSLERPVTLEEKVERVKPDGSKEMTIGYHDCMRRVYTYEFEVDASPLSHPRMSVKIETLEPKAFEVKKSYQFSVSK